jgi:hypothetical protein
VQSYKPRQKETRIVNSGKLYRLLDVYILWCRLEAFVFQFLECWHNEGRRRTLTVMFFKESLNSSIGFACVKANSTVASQQNKLKMGLGARTRTVNKSQSPTCATKR